MANEGAAHPYPADPIRVIHLSGTDREIGRKHAELVGPCSSQGMPKFYYELWRRMLDMGSHKEGALTGAALRAVRWFIDPVLVGRLAAQVPEWGKERLQGVSDVTGVPASNLMTALILPDLLPMLQAYLVRLRPRGFVGVTPPPRFGCTSFMASGERFLVGRNLDFPGVAYWDRYPVIQMTARKGCLKYIGFTSAGVPIAGITGVNEAQISVALHQHYCKVTSVRGTLPFVTAEEILSKARTLDQAREILERSRVASSWAFVVADGKTRDGFIFESHPRASGTVKLSARAPVLGHSNYFQSNECRPHEYATTARMNWDNHWRKSRLELLAAAAGPGMTPDAACRIISDHYDGYWEEEKVTNRTVSQAYNIQSLVFDLGEMKAWVAEGNAPIQIRQYAEYDLSAIFDGKEGRTGESYPACPFADPAMRQAKEAYILSFIAAFGGDFPTAYDGVRRSLDYTYTPEVGMVTGVVAMKLGETAAAYDHFSRAKATLERKMKDRGKTVPPPEYFEACLFLARACDLLGRRGEALEHYRFVASHPQLEDANLRAIAKAAGPYTAKVLARVLMPFATYIPFE